MAVVSENPRHPLAPSSGPADESQRSRSGREGPTGFYFYTAAHLHLAHKDGCGRIFKRDPGHLGASWYEWGHRATVKERHCFFSVCWDGDVRGLAGGFDGIMAGLDPVVLSCMDRQVMAVVGSSH